MRRNQYYVLARNKQGEVRPGEYVITSNPYKPALTFCTFAIGPFTSFLAAVKAKTGKAFNKRLVNLYRKGPGKRPA